MSLRDVYEVLRTNAVEQVFRYTVGMDAYHATLRSLYACAERHGMCLDEDPADAATTSDHWLTYGELLVLLASREPPPTASSSSTAPHCVSEHSFLTLYGTSLLCTPLTLTLT